jgi:LemA protein
MTPPTAAAVFAILVLLVVVLFLALATYNAVVALRNRIRKAWANVDVALKQRHDVLPNLVAAVRDLMAFEQQVLVEVTERRAAYAPDDPIPQQAQTSEQTSQAVRHLFAVVEQYPDVRSAANVAALQEEISRLEESIADRRELYNDQVFRYNTRIAEIPANLLAAVLGWQPEPFFAADPDERDRPGVSLDPA